MNGASAWATFDAALLESLEDPFAGCTGEGYFFMRPA